MPTKAQLEARIKQLEATVLVLNAQLVRASARISALRDDVPMSEDLSPKQLSLLPRTSLRSLVDLLSLVDPRS